MPVRRGVVRFFGLPKVQTPVGSFLTITKSESLYQLLPRKLKPILYYDKLLTKSNAYAIICSWYEILITTLALLAGVKI